MAEKNVTVVYNVSTNQPLMIVVDSNNLADPCFTPPNTAQLPINIDAYNQMTPDEFQAYLASALPPIPSPNPAP